MNMKQLILILIMCGLCFAGNFQRASDTTRVYHKTVKSESSYRTSVYDSPSKPFYNPYSSPTGTHGAPGYFLNPPPPKSIPSMKHHIGPKPEPRRMGPPPQKVHGFKTIPPKKNPPPSPPRRKKDDDRHRR